MPVADQTGLVAALAAHRAEELLGTAEAGWVEFKRQPYALDMPAGRFELAKDVAAMANANGGVIVIGVATSSPPHEVSDVASEVRPFAKELARVDAMRGVLKDWVVPPQRPSLSWFESAPASGLFLLVVTVGALPERERPALVSRTVDEDGRARTRTFGLPVRRGDDTDWLTADHVRLLIRGGMAAGDAGPAHGGAADGGGGGALRAVAAGEALRRWQDLDEAAPALHLVSTVDPAPGMLPGLYARDGVRGWLDGPNGLRHNGFNFHNAYRQAEALPGAVGLASGRGLAVLVAQDGTVAAVVAADRSLLARSGGNDPGLPVSSVVLTEIVHEYLRVVGQVDVRAPGAWTHRVSTTGFVDGGVTLAPGDPGTRWLHDSQPALHELEVVVPGTGDAARDATALLALVYAQFGLDVADNPYVAHGLAGQDVFLAAMGEG